MVTALLKFVQGATTGTPGQALFGATGTVVTVSNGAMSPGPVTTWTFTVVAVPLGSSVPTGVAQSGILSSWSFTPDVTGGYLIELTVSDDDGNTTSDARCFGIKTASNHFVPCFLGDSSSLNFSGQPNGWDPYMEAWLQALESLISGGGGSAPYVQACTSATVTYSGPTPPPTAVRLTGAPGSDFTVNMPETLWATTFINETSGSANAFISNAGTVTGVIVSNALEEASFAAAGVAVCSDGTAVLLGNNFGGEGYSDGVIILDTAGFPSLYISGLGSLNKTMSGEPFVVENIPVYTLLQWFDANTYGVTRPTELGNPGGSGVTVGGVGRWFELGVGAMAQTATADGSMTVCEAPAVAYGSAWNTQAMLIGAAYSGGGTPVGATWGDTLIGPSVSSVFTAALPLGSTNNAAQHTKFVLQGRVVSSSGATETPGDMVTIVQEMDFITVQGAVTILTGSQTKTSFSQVVYPSAGTLANVTLTYSGDNPYVQITISTPAGFDPSTVLDIALFSKETYVT
jgi:hypothetical protein